ncbi:sigma factor-like helix-turn-helix DNA-binding protein [Bacillus sp. JJ1521]|uniref:RNA polymerase sigma factor n=1 Tax=Bacillus sp. JJ1521 TaxID=3122957 RepID=UPI002FFF2725
MEQINHAIQKLRREYRDVLSLKIWHDLKESQIAHILNLKPCTVKTRIYRARKQLKDILNQGDKSIVPPLIY